MGIVVNLDVMMAKRKISLGDLSAKVNITPANMSILKTGKAKANRVIYWNMKMRTTKKIISNNKFNKNIQL